MKLRRFQLTKDEPQYHETQPASLMFIVCLSIIVALLGVVLRNMAIERDALAKECEMKGGVYVEQIGACMRRDQFIDLNKKGMFK